MGMSAPRRQGEETRLDDLSMVEKFEKRLQENIDNERFFEDTEWFLFMTKRMSEEELRHLVLSLASQVERGAYALVQLLRNRASAGGVG